MTSCRTALAFISYFSLKLPYAAGMVGFLRTLVSFVCLKCSQKVFSYGTVWLKSPVACGVCPVTEDPPATQSLQLLRCLLRSSTGCFHQQKSWPCAPLFSTWQGTRLPAQQGGLTQQLSGHLKGMKIYFSSYNGDLQGPWSSKVAISPPADSGACSCTSICIISGRSQRLLLIMLYLQPPMNTDVTFPSERRILSFLSTLCTSQRVIM